MSMNDLLSQLSQICSTLYDQTSSFVSSGPGADSGILDFLLPCPELNLDIPSPDYLVDTLVSTGVPGFLARELSEIHATSSAELANHYLQNYRDACSEVVYTDQDDCLKRYLRLRQAARRMYKRTVSSWETSLVQSVQDRLRSEGGIKKQLTKGPSFNANFGPILEDVFKENPFPSLPMRRALAQKSGMSISQINVWFQNHRSRARKDGKEINKRARKSTKLPMPPKIDATRDERTPEKQSRARSASLSDCETLVGTDSGKDSSSLDTPSGASSVATGQESSDPFTYCAPRSAFPTPCHPRFEDELSVHAQMRTISFPKPTWKRSPSSTSSLPKDVDMSSMVSSFAALRISDDTGLHNDGNDLKTTMGDIQRANTYPFVIRPSPAPLPSLIRRLLRPRAPRTSVTKLAKEAERIANVGRSLVSEWLSFQASCASDNEAQTRCPGTGGNTASVTMKTGADPSATLSVEREQTAASRRSSDYIIDQAKVLPSDGTSEFRDVEKNALLEAFNVPECAGLLDLLDLPDMPTFNSDDANIPPPSFDWDFSTAEFYSAFPTQNALTYAWSPSVCVDSGSLVSSGIGFPSGLPLSELATIDGIFPLTLENLLSPDREALLGKGK